MMDMRAILLPTLLIMAYEKLYTRAVICSKCDGALECLDNSCYGNGCFISKLELDDKHRQSTRRQSVTKGCISGSMLVPNTASHCEVSNGTVPQLCVCNRNFCNRNAHQLAKETRRLSRCYCDDESCHNGTCLALYCSILIVPLSSDRLRPAFRSIRSCVQSKLPLVERRLMGACLMPPLYHEHVQMSQMQLMQSMGCLCTGDYCNYKVPSLQEEHRICPRRLRYDASEINVPLWVRDSECRGQYCYTLDVHRHHFDDNHQIDYGYSGCLTYANDSTQSNKLQLTGKLSLDAESFSFIMSIQPETDAIKFASYQIQNEYIIGEYKQPKPRHIYQISAPKAVHSSPSPLQPQALYRPPSSTPSLNEYSDYDTNMAILEQSMATTSIVIFIIAVFISFSLSAFYLVMHRRRGYFEVSPT